MGVNPIKHHMALVTERPVRYAVHYVRSHVPYCTFVLLFRLFAVHLHLSLHLMEAIVALIAVVYIVV